MKKPLNKVALFLWVVAAATPIFHAVELWRGYVNVSQNLLDGPDKIHLSVGEYMGWMTTTDSVFKAIVQFAILLGIGLLVETADRILWQVRNSD